MYVISSCRLWYTYPLGVCKVTHWVMFARRGSHRTACSLELTFTVKLCAAVALDCRPQMHSGAPSSVSKGSNKHMLDLNDRLLNFILITFKL